MWTELGKAQLDQNLLREAIESFIKAEDPSMYIRVINQAGNEECYEELVQYLLMARKTIKEQLIDSELIYAYARCGEKCLGDLESFVREPNQAATRLAKDARVSSTLETVLKIGKISLQ